jgi:phosphatidylethanolamine-binding protein (PEBP) family uncharacterized protein
LSPPPAWSALPADTAELLLVVEDPDVPLAVPVVHALALIDPARLDTADRLPADALSAARPAAGVQVLRSTVGRGYRGPAPIKGHGPHRYTFQLFALPAAVPGTAESLRRAAPRRLLAAVPGPVLARGRITGSYER